MIASGDGISYFAIFSMWTLTWLSFVKILRITPNISLQSIQLKKYGASITCMNEFMFKPNKKKYACSGWPTIPRISFKTCNIWLHLLKKVNSRGSYLFICMTDHMTRSHVPTLVPGLISFGNYNSATMYKMYPCSARVPATCNQMTIMAAIQANIWIWSVLFAFN